MIRRVRASSRSWIVDWEYVLEEKQYIGVEECRHSSRLRTYRRSPEIVLLCGMRVNPYACRERFLRVATEFLHILSIGHLGRRFDALVDHLGLSGGSVAECPTDLYHDGPLLEVSRCGYPTLCI